MQNRLATIAKTIDPDIFMLDERSEVLRQTTTPSTVMMLLDLLDVPEGSTVLEIGTGSGYSTALLTGLVGPAGRVVSIDVDPNLITRAHNLLTRHGNVPTTLLARDGLAGAAEYGPYDRVIAWTSPGTLPGSWVAQAGEGAVIVAALPAADVARSTVTIRAQIGANGLPHGDRAVAVAFVPMHGPQPPPMIALHDHLAAIAADPDDEHASRWLSARSLAEKPTAASQLLDSLTHASPKSELIVTDENRAALRAFLLTGDRPSLATANLGAYSDWIGAAIPDGAALFDLHGAGYRAVGNPNAAHELRQWITDWRGVGRPNLDSFRPQLTRIDNDWRLLLKVAAPPIEGSR